MKQVTLKEWTDALRSGDYKQGSGELHNIKQDTFCCLGVLCKLTGMEEDTRANAGVFSIDRSKSSIALPESDISYLSDCYINHGLPELKLPTEVRDELENSYTDLRDYTFSRGLPLSALNDVGVPFDIIADLIDKYGEASWETNEST